MDPPSDLEQENAALPELKDFFSGAVVMITSKAERRGCLLCNTATEAMSISPEVQSIVNDFFAAMTKTFRSCLARAVDKKQLDKSLDSENIAAYLTNTFRTVLMLARCGESRRSIQQHVNVALGVLE